MHIIATVYRLRCWCEPRPSSSSLPLASPGCSRDRQFNVTRTYSDLYPTTVVLLLLPVVQSFHGSKRSCPPPLTLPNHHGWSTKVSCLNFPSLSSNFPSILSVPAHGLTCLRWTGDRPLADESPSRFRSRSNSPPGALVCAAKFFNLPLKSTTVTGLAFGMYDSIIFSDLSIPSQTRARARPDWECRSLLFPAHGSDLGLATPLRFPSLPDGEGRFCARFVLGRSNSDPSLRYLTVHASGCSGLLRLVLSVSMSCAGKIPWLSPPSLFSGRSAARGCVYDRVPVLPPPPDSFPLERAALRIRVLPSDRLLSFSRGFCRLYRGCRRSRPPHAPSYPLFFPARIPVTGHYSPLPL